MATDERDDLPTGRRGMTDADAMEGMVAVRADQQRELREALLALGGRATAERLSAETFLSAFSVLRRLAERPDWFRHAPDGRWELVTGVA